MMKTFWRTLEYGARVLAVLLLVVGMGFAGCGGCAFFIGEVTEEPIPFSGLEWFVFVIPLATGIGLYALSGLFKGLAEE